MAIALRDKASNGSAASGTSASITLPGTIQAGDLLIFQVASRSGSNQSYTTPSDGHTWNSIRRDNSGASTGSSQLYWTVALAGDAGASITFTLGVSASWAVGVIAFSGADTTTPIDVQNGQANASGTSCTAPSITSTGSGEWLVFFGAGYVNATFTAPTSPAGMTEEYDTKGLGTSTCCITCDDVSWPTAGATGTVTATLSGAGQNAGQIIAINPGASGPTTVSGTDSAAISEASSIAASPASTDAAVLSESSAISSTATTNDSATTTESASIAATSTSTDSAALTEQPATIGPQTSDSGTLTEGTSAISATTTTTDTSTLVESSAIASTLTRTDAGTLSDTSSVASSLSSTDAATLSDASSIAAGPGSSDSATLTEAKSIAAVLATTDSALLGESVSIVVIITSSDSGTLGESGSVSTSGGTTPTASDSASLSETSSIVAIVVTTDSAVLAESAPVIAIQRTDSGTLVDSSSLTASVQASDAVVLTDVVLNVFAVVTALDSSLLSEASGITIPGAVVLVHPSGVTIMVGALRGSSGEVGNLRGTTTVADEPRGSTSQ